MTIAAIILAAGSSRRLGQPKQLLRLDGESLLRATAITVRATSCDQVCAVLGANATKIAPELDGLGVTVLHNAGWSEGMASSIRCGVTWAMHGGHDAVAICVCDQPRLTARHVDELIAKYRATGAVVASRYDGKLGVPAVFPRPQFRQLLALTGDQGARSVIANSPDTIAMAWPDGAQDIDTPEDAAELARHVSSGRTL